MNRKKIGDVGESFAIDYLVKNGMTIIDRNYYTKYGEIDIVFKDGKYLVFAEVKDRNGSAWGTSTDAVTYTKTRKIYNSARIYLYNKHISENSFIRFDVIAIQNGEINWIKNAFN